MDVHTGLDTGVEHRMVQSDEDAVVPCPWTWRRMGLPMGCEGLPVGREGLSVGEDAVERGAQSPWQSHSSNRADEDEDGSESDGEEIEVMRLNGHRWVRGNLEFSDVE
ncbi:hypothetical protein B0H10DRAFT_2228392 [Mycena sp. CBHHK59/15]|nr:hypothetical protein B0H10DRAFT_2228392 [Mycena sp. CBHHK59/15]